MTTLDETHDAARVSAAPDGPATPPASMAEPDLDAVLLRGRDAGLVPSLEGDRGRHGGAGGRLLAAEDRGGAETGDAESGPAGGEAEQPAAREAVAHETTAEVSSDSGSDSASTCAASAFTCAGVSAL